MADESTAHDMAVDLSKKDPERDDGSSSVATTPEADPDTYTQENPQQPKRKGGRKPIYATSEERKQRNRQAQAAFRERRTEYIKQLESTIKHHEEQLQSLQQSHRSAADECLMLRYKNSLLERILLEKGIDVTAELQAKTGSPNLGPTHVPAAPTTTSPSQAPMRNAIMNRHQQARRSLVGMPHKVEGVPNVSLGHHEGTLTNRSPLSQPTSASHLSSPATSATKSPNFLPQGGSIQSPNFGPISQPPPPTQHLRPQQQPPRSHYTQMAAPPQRPSVLTQQQHSSSGMSSGASSAMGANQNVGGTGYYPTGFQSHMDQLEQEYNAQADMLEDQDPSDQSAGPHPYPPQQFPAIQQQQLQQQQPPTQQRAPRSAQLQPQPSPHALNPNMQHAVNQNFSPATLQPADASGGFQNMNYMFDPSDPTLDADPFGLSASMHFPTQFQYESR